MKSENKLSQWQMSTRRSMPVLPTSMRSTIEERTIKRTTIRVECNSWLTPQSQNFLKMKSYSGQSDWEWLFYSERKFST